MICALLTATISVIYTYIFCKHNDWIFKHLCTFSNIPTHSESKFTYHGVHSEVITKVRFYNHVPPQPNGVSYDISVGGYLRSVVKQYIRSFSTNSYKQGVICRQLSNMGWISNRYSSNVFISSHTRYGTKRKKAMFLHWLNLCFGKSENRKNIMKAENCSSTPHTKSHLYCVPKSCFKLDRYINMWMASSGTWSGIVGTISTSYNSWEHFLSK